MEPMIFVPPNDVITPTSISAFPPSWALLGLIGFMIVTIIWCALAWFRFKRIYQAQQHAIVELANMTLQPDTDGFVTITAYNRILKRLAIHYYGNSVHLLHGQAWADWLVAQLPHKHAGSHNMGLQTIALSVYQADSQSSKDTSMAFDSAVLWCQKALPRFDWFRLTQQRLPTSTHVSSEQSS